MSRRKLALSLVGMCALAVSAFAGVAQAADPSFAVVPGVQGPVGSIAAFEICPGDFNADGNTDVAAATLGAPDGLYVAYGDGNGGIGAWSLVAASTVGAAQNNCAAGDFNGDGRTDLASGDYGATGVRISLSTGAAFTTNPVATPLPVRDLEAGRLDPGPVLDLAVAESLSPAASPGSVETLIGNGSGGFAALPTPPSSGGDNPTRIHLADLNGDARDDAVVTHPTSPPLGALTATLLATGTGLLASQEVNSGSTSDFALGDVNGDFRADFVFANGNRFAIWLGDGNGNLDETTPGQDYPDPTVLAIAQLLTLALGDFNGDGQRDVLAGDNDGVAPTDFWAFSGTGGPANPLFSEVAIGPILPNPNNDTPRATVGADMNNDNRLDAIVGMSVIAPTVSILLNTTPIPPGLLTQPSITGNPAVGNTLTCQPGTWTGKPSFSFQWLRNGVPIAGATGNTHLLSGHDAGSAISCRVTATTSGGAVSAPSASVNVPGVRGVTCLVPKVKGKTIKAAKRKLRKAGCKLGKIAGRGSDRGRGRRVIGTEPHAGLVADGPVDLFVTR